MIEPFFFDNSKLFGCYHAADDWSAPRLLVICPPLFDEYRRCYRALSDLANACAQKNVHVVRFDYFGTGESQGDLKDAAVDEWIHGIEAAIEEGIVISGAEDVVLVGVRFGATLAAQTNSALVSRKIFWDPVESGQAYLHWLKQVNHNISKEHLEMARAVNSQLEKRPYENFSLSQKLSNGIAALLLDKENICAKKDNFIISTNKIEASNSNQENLIFANFDYDWPMYHDGLLNPKPVLESIAQKVLLP